MQFAFRLCLALGITHPRHLPLTAADFVEWEAYASLEPWGFEVANARNAQLCSVVANFSGNTRRALSPVDFMPRRPESEPPQQTVAEKVRKLFGFGR